MTSLLRRATGRTPSGSKDFGDTSSLFSSTSQKSTMFRLPRALSKKSSVSSVRTDLSRLHADNISISSRRTGGIGSDRTPSDYTPFVSPSVSRSAASIRRLATPPSSFPARAVGGESRYMGDVSSVFDEDNLKTAKDIRQEMLSVEAEARRLMDAFNGLELTTLTRVQRRQGRHPLVTENGNGADVDSTWTLIPDNKSQRRINVADNDGISLRSGTSAGTAPSMARSAYSGRKVVRQKTSLNTSFSLSSSRPGSLHRKNSASSLGSQERRAGRGSMAPPVPALPSTATYGHLGVSNNSSVSLARSTGYAPMDVVPEDKLTSGTTLLREEEVHFETEMEDIQRRRAEVSVRYEARLEYLRAKLKGAQLHEKLLRK